MTAFENHQVAVLTPAGAGAIALIRVTGPDASGVVSAVFRGAGHEPSLHFVSDRLVRGQIVDGGEAIDEVLLGAPPPSVERRGTATPPIDITCHGGTRVVERILRVFESRGAAVCFAPSIDSCWPSRHLIECEAMAALATAKTARAVRFAAFLRTHLPPELERIADLFDSDRQSARERLAALAAGYPAASVMLNGATVAMVGPPNSGKSTLFNRLVGRTAAVTSPIPGTTRDWVSQTIELGGAAVTFVDTAGVREVADALERLSIAAGRKRVEEADVSIAVLDASLSSSTNTCDERTCSYRANKAIVVLNKSDLPLGLAAGEPQVLQPSMSPKFVRISAKTGLGLKELRQVLIDSLGIGGFRDDTCALFTDRQCRAATHCLKLDDQSASAFIRTQIIGFSS